MTTLTIKNVPEGLYRRLKERAAVHRRSINSEVLVCLELVLRRSPMAEDELLAELKTLREQAGVYVTDDALRRAVEEGRP